MKAYNIFPGDSPYDEGCLLVFAENRNQAKLIGMKACFWPGVTYVEMSARRVKNFDKHIKGGYTILRRNERGIT